MGDTPVAVISREPERVKVSLVLVPILSITLLCTEQYVSSMAELFLVMTCRYT